jgi:hypothetical protein
VDPAGLESGGDDLTCFIGEGKWQIREAKCLLDLHGAYKIARDGIAEVKQLMITRNKKLDDFLEVLHALPHSDERSRGDIESIPDGEQQPAS